MNEINRKLNNKKIAILGLGTENISLVEFIKSIDVGCDITICDAKKKGEIIKWHDELSRYELKWHLGQNYDTNLDKFDIIIRVPGYPLFTPALKKARETGVEISSSTKLFFDFCHRH